MPTEETSIDKQLQVVANMEQEAVTALENLHKTYPSVFEEMARIDKMAENVQKLKDAVKQKLIDEGDFDLHQVGKLTVSLSAVAKIKVTDIDKVPDDFKEVKTVVDEKKAREYLKIMHRAPEGCEDNSYYRLNWKVEKEGE